MIIAINFDKTFSEAPNEFKEMVLVFMNKGHSVICVSDRIDQFKMGDEVRSMINNLMPIVFTGNLSKKEAVKKAGYMVDIWIDNKPESIK